MNENQREKDEEKKLKENISIARDRVQRIRKIMYIINVKRPEWKMCNGN